MDYKLAIDIFLFIITLVVALYAIHDVRDRVKHLIELERGLAWVRLMHIMVWDYAEPTGQGRTKEAASALSAFVNTSQALDPDKSTNTLTEAAEKEALALAASMCKNGDAVWKHGLDVKAAEEMLKDWEKQKDEARAGLKKKRFLLWR